MTDIALAHTSSNGEKLSTGEASSSFMEPKSRLRTTMRTLAQRIFIEGLTGMAHGLFATLIIGTILVQIGTFLPGGVGETVIMLGKVAQSITGAGIGIGAAYRLKSSTFVLISAGVAGQIGALAAGLLAGTTLVATDSGTALHLTGPGEPLGAFIAAYVAIEVGRAVSGKTPVDILVTPLTTIIAGGGVGLLVGPPISRAMRALGDVVNWGTERQPFVMGIIVAVIMGIVLTLPISSAALGIILGLSGLAAGAATIGCVTQMVGFAAASFRENRWSGVLAQGLGTSMLQVPNIVRHPLIWVPPTLASAILGPVSSVLLHMESNAVGSGMGSAGLVGQIMTWNVMGATTPHLQLAVTILLFHFVAPALLTLGISEFMRKQGWIKPGDMALPQA
ncbi:PTS sugar transporter subunit IIC [Schaalia sp. ZJ1691]|uniref:PTS transporter subunit IIC n=1 Tax=Schaalia sp. ZJ1691 TaxID=2709404 RepID=UPI001F154C4C|nr:PTS sugar transporter subunit IIC [Schaalia sp. ZJ1691]